MAVSIFKRSTDAESESIEVTRPAESLQFNFSEFFSGHTRASGWFTDRFGRPRRHFCGDFYGQTKARHFSLSEKLYYANGFYEERIWYVDESDDGSFRAESDSLIGAAIGHIEANVLTMCYTMRVVIDRNKVWTLDMKDSMLLQPDGSLHNITHVHKWGVRIGTVSTQYQRHDGEMLCADSQWLKNSA